MWALAIDDVGEGDTVSLQRRGIANIEYVSEARLGTPLGVDAATGKFKPGTTPVIAFVVEQVGGRGHQYTRILMVQEVTVKTADEYESSTATKTAEIQTVVDKELNFAEESITRLWPNDLKKVQKWIDEVKALTAAGRSQDLNRQKATFKKLIAKQNEFDSGLKNLINESLKFTSDTGMYEDSDGNIKATDIQMALTKSKMVAQKNKAIVGELCSDFVPKFKEIDDQYNDLSTPNAPTGISKDVTTLDGAQKKKGEINTRLAALSNNVAAANKDRTDVYTIGSARVNALAEVISKKYIGNITNQETYNKTKELLESPNVQPAMEQFVDTYDYFKENSKPIDDEKPYTFPLNYAATNDENTAIFVAPNSYAGWIKAFTENDAATSFLKFVDGLDDKKAFTDSVVAPDDLDMSSLLKDIKGLAVTIKRKW